MTSFLQDFNEIHTEPQTIEELLQNTLSGQTVIRIFSWRWNFCSESSASADMSEDERLVAVVVADIFMIQDSNSHPVFRLDLASHSNEVGLETIGQLEIKSFFDLLKRGEKK